MSHSTHVGFNDPPAAVLRLSPPSRPEDPGPPSPSLLVGVGHITCAARLGVFRRRSLGDPLFLESFTRGVGHVRDGVPQSPTPADDPRSCARVRRHRGRPHTGPGPIESSDGRNGCAGLGDWLLPYGVALGVGNDEDAGSEVRGTNARCRWYATLHSRSYPRSARSAATSPNPRT